MTSLIFAISLAAIAGTPHCLGMCGGFAVAASEGGLWPYQLGRISVYVALGAIAGALGRWIPGPSWVATALSAALIIAMSASLAGYLPEPSLRLPGLHKLAHLLRGRTGPSAAFGLGLLNGLLPCGLLYGALALPVASGTALNGALLMLVFGAWTALPLTLAVTGLRRVLLRPHARTALAGLTLCTGLLGLYWRAPSLTPTDDAAPACHQPGHGG